MPCRFADMPPRDFERFVAQFFRDNDFSIKQIKHSSDYGIDIIATKGQQRFGIQVKRYAEDRKVGVKDVNQAVGGSRFYDCEHVIVISTSGFTQPARKLAEETGIELWDWNEFQKRLSNTYLDGRSYQEYFGLAEPANNLQKPVSAEIINIEKAEMKGKWTGILLYVQLRNRTANNVYVTILDATYITKENNQYFKRAFLEGYFVEGVVYAKCAVETCLVFDFAQLNSVTRGDKVILDILIDESQHSLILRVPKSKVFYDCFIATATFGTPMSREVRILRQWRDRQLRKTEAGQLVIAIYYRVSPPIARWIRDKPIAQMVIRYILRLLIAIITRSR